MSVAEMKNKITNELEKFEEAELSFIFYIIEIKHNPKYTTNSIDSVFEEAVHKYGNTLKKLAQ